jgi:photosystem II stability/assembly factor-like uncharacterized protein
MPYAHEYKKSSGKLFGLLLVVAVSAVYAVSPIISPGRAAQADVVGAWTLSGFTNSNVRSVAVDPVYPHIVYAQVDNRAIYKSTDSGATWNTGSTGLPQSGLSSGDTLTIHPLNTSILYVGSARNGVYQSTDGGFTWFKSSTGMRASVTVQNLVISRSDPNILFAASHAVEDTYRSLDGGASWKVIGTNGFIAGMTVRAIAVNPVEPSVVYLAAEAPFQRADSGIFKSIDGGASWSRIDPGADGKRMTK